MSVINFLGQGTVGAGWNAVGGGGGTSSGAGTGAGSGSSSRNSVYEDANDYLRRFFLQGEWTIRLNVLTGAMQTAADATSTGGRSDFARFSQAYNGSNEINRQVIAEAFRALQTEDLSLLNRRGSLTNLNEISALARIDQSLERIMLTNNLRDPATGGINTTDRDRLAETIQQLLDRTRTDTRRDAEAITDLTEFARILGTAQSSINEFQQRTRTLSTDDPAYAQALQQIQNTAEVFRNQSGLLAAHGFSGLAEIQDPTVYRERRTREERQRLGRDLNETEIQGLSDEWSAQMRALVPLLAPVVDQMRDLGQTARETLDDLNDPDRWTGITDTLTGALDNAQRAANAFSDALGNMGFPDAGRSLQGFTRQLSGFLNITRQLQGASRQMQGWQQTLANRARTTRERARVEQNQAAEPFRQRARQARQHEARAMAAGDTISAARYRSHAAAQDHLASNAFRTAARPGRESAIAVARLSGMIGRLGTIAARAAGPVGLIAGAITPLVSTAMEITRASYAATAKRINAIQERTQEVSDTRILTKANDAALATASAQREAQTNIQEWQKTADVYQMRTRMLSMELAVSEELIQMEVERMKAADKAADYVQSFENSIREGEKDIENVFKESERAGRWESTTGWFANTASNGIGDTQIGTSWGDAIGSAITTGLAGALTGAAVGAASGLWGGPLAALTAGGGALIGGLVGAGGSLLGSALGAGAGARSQSDMITHFDRGWGTGQDRQIEASVNARNLRENRELESAAKAQFEILNAPLKQLAQQFHAFGQNLPEDEMMAFEESLKRAKEANETLAVSMSQLERLERAAGMSNAELDANYADRVTSWLPWRGDVITGYQARVGDRDIVHTDRDEFQRLMAEARSEWQERVAQEKALAEAPKQAAQLETKRLAEVAKYNDALFNAQKRGKEAERDSWKTIGENITNTQQSYQSIATNIGAALISQDFAQRKGDIEKRITQREQELMDPVFTEEQALNAQIQAGAFVGREHELEAKQKEIAEKKEKAKEQAYAETGDARREMMDVQRQESLAKRQNALDEEISAKRRDFHLDEHEKRMRFEVEYNQKALELENSLHKDRLTKLEEYAKTRKQALEKYVGTSLETFASSRGANPLEEAKKMGLAATEKDNASRMAQIRMRQEMAIANMRSQHEMELANKKMAVDAKLREVEMNFQVDLMKWKAEHEIALQKQLFEKAKEYNKAHEDWEQRRDKDADVIAAGKDQEKKKVAIAKFKEKDAEPEMLLDIKVKEPPKRSDFHSDMQNTLNAANQEQADMQKRQANAMHNLQMKNIDEEHKHSLSYMIERAKKERELYKDIYLDKFRAQQINLQSTAESTQRTTDTSFATSVFGAKSGQDRMKAFAQYQMDSQYNAQKAQMEQKHAAELERLEIQGATEEQRARLKQQQEREKNGLEQEKSFKDAIVNSLGATGTLRDIAKEQGVGQKSGLAEAHERMKASAFGHVKDPAADAINRMAKEQALQHAQYMQFWAQHVPQMLTAMQKQGNVATMNTINNLEMGLSAGPL